MVPGTPLLRNVPLRRRMEPVPTDMSDPYDLVEEGPPSQSIAVQFLTVQLFSETDPEWGETVPVVT